MSHNIDTQRPLNPVIVVPAHQNNYNSQEQNSVRQLQSILGEFPIVFVGPQTMKQEINNLFPKASFESFNENYFLSIKTYNQLLLTKKFYERFANFSHMLIFQLDAYVFRNELLEWCSMEHDYVGAPWFEGYENPLAGNSIVGVGNGGFSLRKLSSVFRVFQELETVRSLNTRLRLARLSGRSRLDAFVSSFNFTRQNVLANLWTKNEDVFWGSVAPSLFSWFRTAPFKEAIKFSFEVNPVLLFKENKYSLPFGCHAWNKYEPDFWANFIPV